MLEKTASRQNGDFNQILQVIIIILIFSGVLFQTGKMAQNRAGTSGGSRCSSNIGFFFSFQLKFETILRDVLFKSLCSNKSWIVHADQCVYEAFSASAFSTSSTFSFFSPSSPPASVKIEAKSCHYNVNSSLGHI